MSRDFSVTGLKDLDAYLSALPKNMQKQAYRAGLVAAAKPIRDEARVRVNKQSGKLAKAIRTGSPRQNEDGTFSVSVSVSGRQKGSHAFLGLFMEYGVKPHYIARTGKGEGRVALRKAKDGTGTIKGGVMRIGDEFVSGIISHPGYSAHPFLRPALDAKAGEAVKAFADRIRAFLEQKTGFVAPLDEAD